MAPRHRVTCGLFCRLVCEKVAVMPRPLRLAVLFAFTLAVAGCGLFDDAVSSAERARLIDDMASQLERGNGVSYVAYYQLAGGVRATVAHHAEPSRTVMTFPGGLILQDATGQTQCETTLHPVKCQVRTLTPAAAGLADSYAEATKRGLIAGPVVRDLLRLAWEQPSAVLEPLDATIVGHPASCLKVSGLTGAPASSFTACVTSDGVLASFTGDLNGLLVDQALVRVGGKPPDETFALPEGAKIQDLRQS